MCSGLSRRAKRRRAGGNFFVPNEEIWESPLTFSLDYSFDEVARIFYRNVTTSTSDGNVTYELVADILTLDRANFSFLRLNNNSFSLHGLSSDFNQNTNEFLGNLVFELWIFDEVSSDFVYHERYVDLKLNMTKT